MFVVYAKLNFSALILDWVTGMAAKTTRCICPQSCLLATPAEPVVTWEKGWLKQKLKVMNSNEPMNSHAEVWSCDVGAVVFVWKESLVMSSITKELQLKETRQELETHRQEHSDQQQVDVRCFRSTLITFPVAALLIIRLSSGV